MLQETDAPRRVDQARAVMRSFRERLGLAGGVVAVAGVAGHAADFALALPLASVGLGGLLLLYSFPVTERARRARAVLSDWTQKGRLATDEPDDDRRITAAEAMVDRIVDYSGAEPRAVAAAQAIKRVLYDSLDDLGAIDLLRAADEGTDGESASTAGLSRKAAVLENQVNERMNRALTVIADLYEAVLAHDAIALSDVVQSAEDELTRLRAEQEVEESLGRTPRLEPAKSLDPAYAGGKTGT